MSKKLADTIAESAGELVALVIGWGFCMTMAAGAYFIGSLLAPYFGGAEHRETFGILSAIVFIWLYEHRIADERWGRLCVMIGNINAPRER